MATTTSTPPLAVVGAEASAFKNEELDVSTLPNREDAEHQVSEGEKDAAVVLKDGKAELISKGSPSPQIQATVAGSLNQLSQATALQELGVKPEDYQTHYRPIPLEMTDTKAKDESDLNPTSITTVLGGLFIIMFIVMLFAGNTGGRVTEEKSSRIVELILASTRPVDFLAGKLLGNVVFGLVGGALLTAASVAALKISGLATDLQVSWGVVPLLLLSLVLGLLFFSSLYAGAGALVSRTEDLQSSASPIMFILMAAFYAPFVGIQFLHSTAMQVLTWVPPVSITVAPVQYAYGNITFLQALASLGLDAVATILILLLIARVYRNAILHNGQRMKWRQAIRG